MTSSRLFVLVTVICAVECVISCVGNEPSSGGDDTTSDGSATDGTSGDGTTGSDGSASDSGSIDAGPKSFCDTASKPDGAADFFCADFDEADFARGLLDASDNTDGSTIGPTSAVFLSPPQSLESNVGATDFFENAYYEWQQPGAQALKQIVVTTGINPTGLPSMLSADGDVFLLGVEVQSVQVDFGYTHGGATDDASTYTGYVVHIRKQSGDLVTFDLFPVGTIPENTWTTVTLAYDLITGQVSVFYNGALGGSKVTNATATDTLATVTVGGRTFGSTQAGTWRFDNFEIATTRGP